MRTTTVHTFEGRPIDVLAIKIKAHTDDGSVPFLKDGDEIEFVARGYVKNIDHGEDKDENYVRTHVVEIRKFAVTEAPDHEARP